MAPENWTTGLLIFNDVEELDFVGPWEVFTSAIMNNPVHRVVTVAETAEPIKCAKGLRVLSDHTLEDAPPLDLLLIPGGMGTRREVKNQRLLDWIAQAAENCTWVTSVCTGALLLAAAGPARDKRVTTHWGFIDQLRKRGEAAEVLENVRYVHDGNIVTAAGVSAGIDMALWLVGQIYGVEHARQVQHYIEYDPVPPYQTEV
ncbi:MAG: DJ-1/PfpI family protein [Pseudomonadota bacterium]